MRKKRTETQLLRLTPREKQRWQQLANELELPASELMRLSMRAGLPWLRRKFAEPAAKEA